MNAKNQMCVSGRTVEVKLLCNFSKIAKICNIFPNKGMLLNRLSYRGRGLTNATRSLIRVIHWFPLHLSLWGIQNWFEKRPQCIRMSIVFDGELQRRITWISEQIDFTPNKTKEVSLPKISKRAIGRKNMPFLVIIMMWLGEHRAFIVKCFLKTESYETVQHAFLFKLKRRNSVLSHVTISKWVRTFQKTSAAVSGGWYEGREAYKQRRIAKNCEWQLRQHHKSHFVNTHLHYISRSVQHIKC